MKMTKNFLLNLQHIDNNEIAVAIDQFVGRLVSDQKVTSLSSISLLAMCRRVFEMDTFRITFHCSRTVEPLRCSNLIKNF